MPRAWTETIEDWPKLGNGLCLVIVCDVERLDAPPSMRVTLEHLDPEQLGRRTVVVLPRPCRPAGPTSEFFLACAQKTAVGEKVEPKACVGRTIRTRFATDASGEVRVVAFEAEETTHVQQPAEPAVQSDRDGAAANCGKTDRNESR